MKKIKEGQIYEWAALDVRLVVYDVQYSETMIDGDIIKSISNIICTGNNGENYMFCTDLSKEWNLIAEYPTWQEAVNSKEFKS